MNNQNNLIFAGVAVVITIGVLLAMMFMARKPFTAPAITTVPTSPVSEPDGAVVYSDSLPNGGSGSGSGFGGGAPASLGRGGGGGREGAGMNQGPVAAGIDSTG